MFDSSIRERRTVLALMEPTSWAGSIFNGTWRTGAGGSAPVIEPATGLELGRTGVASAADVAAAAASAAAAQREWAAESFENRAAVLRRAGALWERHHAEVEKWIVSEAGSTAPKAGVETERAAQECYEAAALASRPLGEVLPTTAPRLSMTRRLPTGVVGVISPFNFPLILAINSVAPALALGNAVLLKPDPRTTVSGGVSIARVFEEAGLPAGVLHLLPGGADVGAALVNDPHVRTIAFTGSTAAGRKVAEAGARHLKRVHLELGGNSALVVLDDADLELAVGAAAWGSFLHQGQICMTTGRHIVHEQLADEYVSRLAGKADALVVGNPTTDQVALGPIIDAAQRDKIHTLVGASVEAGARVAAGGTYEGLFYRPTVLDDVTCTMPAWSEEIFGPVAPVMRFSDIDEAAALAADTRYGLALGILTRDTTKGLALAERIPSGVVHINDQTVDANATSPFGGVGDSGNGARIGGAAASIEAFTETQWVTVRGSIPAYPM
jgi:benzaldehyde dehydrogenase (NAD)